jgi:hypothetical protein
MEIAPNGASEKDAIDSLFFSNMSIPFKGGQNAAVPLTQLPQNIKRVVAST